MKSISTVLAFSLAAAIGVFFILLVAAKLPAGQARGDERMQPADALFSGLISDAEPGAAVAVVKDGGVVFERGYGVADLRTKGRARIWHYGETSGFRTAIQRFTDDRLTVIVLCNRADLDAAALALQTAGLFLNE